MITDIHNIFGPALSDAEALNILKKDIPSYNNYLSFSPIHKEQILRFIGGRESLCITYDEIFKRIFSYQYHKSRIERLISDILGRSVIIEEELSREGSQITENSSFIIMDIIVRDADGSLINVEMQKNGYCFSGERADCYISDAILRQYTREKERRGSKFSYGDMKCCYLIVLIENSTNDLQSVSPEYIHIKNQHYSSNAPIKSISNIRFISLDTYNKTHQNKPIETSLDAWLTFLSATDFARINELITTHPEFIEMYQEIAEFRRKPKELVGMFLSSFADTDRATERYMIDEIKKEVEEKEAIIAEKEIALAEKDDVIAEKEIALAEKDDVIAEKDALIAELRAQLK